MRAKNMSERLMPSGAEYERLAREEIDHYTKIFLDAAGRAGESPGRSLFQPVPASWIEVERRAAERIRQRTGRDFNEHVLARLRRNAGVRLLSLGSGPGGIELALAREAREAQISCIDLNPALISLGQEQAKKESLSVDFAVADLNTAVLPENEFDYVLCHASLHHVLDLEHLVEQIKRTLRSGGELLVVDVITQNGYLMWPETREMVCNLWSTIPARFRINHTAYEKPRVDERIWESDTSTSSMECIRAAEILPTLSAAFGVREFVPYFSISRRFFDTMYGPNYDLDLPLDAALLNWLWQLDLYYLESKQLRPETFFGIYSR